MATDGTLVTGLIDHYFEQLLKIYDFLGLYSPSDDVPVNNIPSQMYPVLCCDAIRGEHTPFQYGTVFISDSSISLSAPIGIDEITGEMLPPIYPPNIELTYYWWDNGTRYSRYPLSSSWARSGDTYFLPTYASYGHMPVVCWASDALTIYKADWDDETLTTYNDNIKYKMGSNYGDALYIARSDSTDYDTEYKFFNDIIKNNPQLNVPSDYVIPSFPKDPHDLGSIPSIDIPSIPEIPIDFDALEGTTADAGGLLQWMLNAYTEIGIAPVLLFCMAVCIVITALRR